MYLFYSDFVYMLINIYFTHFTLYTVKLIKALCTYKPGKQFRMGRQQVICLTGCTHKIIIIDLMKASSFNCS